jgi:hypothetical protein
MNTQVGGWYIVLHAGDEVALGPQKSASFNTDRRAVVAGCAFMCAWPASAPLVLRALRPQAAVGRSRRQLTVHASVPS